MDSSSLIKELCERTGAGMIDCKRALEATNGNIEEATELIREIGYGTCVKIRHCKTFKEVYEILFENRR